MLRDAVISAARRPGVVEGVADIYAQLQQAIDLRRPRCDQSGSCCRFDEFGHRLYVTTVELAAFAASLSVSERETGGPDCPFQVEGLCSVHTIRPFGCRVYFCDATATRWQQEQYERFHDQLRKLHDALKVPYFYVEWRQALRELGWTSSPVKAAGRKGLSLPQVQL